MYRVIISGNVRWTSLGAIDFAADQNLTYDFLLANERVALFRFTQKLKTVNMTSASHIQRARQQELFVKLLNIILNHFYLASPVDFRIYHTAF